MSQETLKVKLVPPVKSGSASEFFELILYFQRNTTESGKWFPLKSEDNEEEE